jgi:DNA invertase Pin-like site-specific DNA recombinase
MFSLSHPLQPKRSGHPLAVIVIGRISTPQQDEANITASQSYAENFVRQFYTDPIKFLHLGEQASGMVAERETITQTLELIATGEWDLVITEDLSRIYRNPRFQWAFVQECVDQNVRLICIADGIDTADSNWETLMHTAAIRHGLAIPDTRRRVRRTASFAFQNGGMVMKIRFGYRKLSKEEAASGQFGPPGLRIAKRPEDTPIIRQLRDRVMRGDSPTALAAWLNAEGVNPGPYVTSGRWTGQLVEDLLRDPILSGTRTFRDVISKQVFRSGKYRRFRNEEGPDIKHYPELAHLTPEEQTAMIAALDARAGNREFLSGPDHPLWNQPRERSLWPGQHAVCAACNGLMYRTGDFLKCANALPKGTLSCWNHVQVYFEHIHTMVLDWLLRVLQEHPRFRETLIESTWTEFERAQRRSQGQLVPIDQRITERKRQADNLAKAIALGGNLEALLTELKVVQSALACEEHEREELLAQAEQARGFSCREEVAARLDAALPELAAKSLDFADFMRRLIPRFVIQPVQALDCPLVRPRAKLTLDLNAWCPGGEVITPIDGVLDLFRKPEHILHLSACVGAKQCNPGASYRTIAAQLGIGYMTVKRAFHYANRMVAAGVSDPYVELHERPAVASRWRKRCKKGDQQGAA